MENAVVRETKRHDCRIGDNCLIGPNAHVVGCTVDHHTLIATGASVFHGARVGARSEIRINAVVHIKTHLLEGSTVSIGWIAVGEPARFLPPEQHEEIWALQRPLDFPGWVYGLDRGDPDLMIAITTRLSEEMGGATSDFPESA
jgi:carbonic anhydrase/acetyltransferase-like protein (isoleucine patch superfamily)